MNSQKREKVRAVNYLTLISDRLMQHTKIDSGWLLSEYETEDAVIKLAAVDLELELGDLYARVDFKS